MRHRSKVVLLSILAVLLLLFVCRESYQFFSELRHLDLPRHDTREPLGRSVHGWMTAEELADFYKVPVEEVFAALEIVPAAGDENLPLRELAEKYCKTPADMETAIKILQDNNPSRGDTHHG